MLLEGMAVQEKRPYLARTEEFALPPTPMPLLSTAWVCSPLGETQRSRLRLALKAFRSVGRQSSLPKPRSWVAVRSRVWNWRSVKRRAASHCAAVAVQVAMKFPLVSNTELPAAVIEAISGK